MIEVNGFKEVKWNHVASWQMILLTLVGVSIISMIGTILSGSWRKLVYCPRSMTATRGILNRMDLSFREDTFGGEFITKFK